MPFLAAQQLGYGLVQPTGRSVQNTEVAPAQEEVLEVAVAPTEEEEVVKDAPAVVAVVEIVEVLEVVEVIEVVEELAPVGVDHESNKVPEDFRQAGATDGSRFISFVAKVMPD